MKNYCLILAAGKSTRMKTQLPKCALPIMKRPMIEYVMDAANSSFVDKTLLVVGYKSEVFNNIFKDSIEYIYQYEQLGTGHAVMVAKDSLLDIEGDTIIIYGDLPLITSQTIDDVHHFHIENNNDITAVSTKKEQPFSYGRIIRKNGQISKIVEEQEANDEEKKCQEVCAGLFCIKTSVLVKYINDITKENSKKEYYLTDIIKIGLTNNLKVGTYLDLNKQKYIGVNDLLSLSKVETYLKQENCIKHLKNGVRIIAPETVTISSEVIIESGAIIYPNTFITGKTLICQNAEIGPNSEVHNSIIGKNSKIIHSLILDSTIYENTNVGPFAHIRNHSVLKNNLRIGNFVEIKNSTIDDGSKISHLTYIGDTVCGKNVNWGCGCVTVNYDGKYKNKTVVGDNCFIGCNTNLIAPINIGNNVFIAAGSTITNDIPDAAFSIARERQITKDDYSKKYEYYKKFNS